jgi:hypothetical protein
MPENVLHKIEDMMPWSTGAAECIRPACARFKNYVDEVCFTCFTRQLTLHSGLVFRRLPLFYFLFRPPSFSISHAAQQTNNSSSLLPHPPNLFLYFFMLSASILPHFSRKNRLVFLSETGHAVVLWWNHNLVMQRQPAHCWVHRHQAARDRTRRPILQRGPQRHHLRPTP